MSNYEVFAVLLKMVPLGPLVLIGRKGLPEIQDFLVFHIQRGTPNMNLTVI